MIRRTFLFVIMLGALLPVATVAQNRELVANIPFAFTVCNRQMPAGKYKVRPMTSATTNLLLVRSDDGQFAEITCTHDVQGSRPSSGGKLIFNRYGNQYFLAELWFAGEMTGNEVFKSDREEAVIREWPKQKRGKVTIRVTEAKP
jgi:hypothetical protein